MKFVTYKTRSAFGSTLLALTLFLHTPLMADDAEQFPFIGLSVGLDTLNFDDTAGIPKEDKTAIGFHIGKQTQEWRTLFGFNANNDAQSAFIEVDKILFQQLFGKPEIRPYIGATVGYLHNEEVSELGDNGFYYGGNIGFLLYASDVVDVDISYHYYQVSELDPLDTMQGFGVSIHYFY